MSDNANQIYPMCYKIKEISHDKYVECLELFSKYLVVQNNTALRDGAMKDLDNCLDSYGNMYQRLNIIIVLGGIRHKLPLLPANDADGSIRIQSSMTTYMTEIGREEPTTALEAKFRIENLNMYSLLLYNKFREYYNDFYMRRNMYSVITSSDSPVTTSASSPFSSASSPFSSASSPFLPASATTTGGKKRRKLTRKRYKYRTSMRT